MIDTRVENLVAEYVRMLIVLFGVAAVLAVIRLQPSKVWPIAVLLVATLRGMGPIGSGLWRNLFTAATLGGLVLASFELPAAAMTLLGLLGVKIVLEVVDEGLSRTK